MTHHLVIRAPGYVSTACSPENAPEHVEFSSDIAGVTCMKCLSAGIHRVAAEVKRQVDIARRLTMRRLELEKCGMAEG